MFYSGIVCGIGTQVCSPSGRSEIQSCKINWISLVLISRKSAAQFVSNVVDYNMNIQAAMEEPRFTDRQQLGCKIVIESRVNARHP